MTLAFRVQHGLDAADVRPHAPHKSTEPRVKEYWDVRCPGNTLIVTFPDKKRGGVCFIDLGGMVPGASHKLSFATWEYAFIYTSEWTFQWLDYITRTTGRLTRSVRIVELQKITMSTFNRRDMKFDGNIITIRDVGCVLTSRNDTQCKIETLIKLPATYEKQSTSKEKSEPRAAKGSHNW